MKEQNKKPHPQHQHHQHHHQHHHHQQTFPPPENYSPEPKPRRSHDVVFETESDTEELAGILSQLGGHGSDRGQGDVTRGAGLWGDSGPAGEMDVLKTFDLDLDKEIYYAGETVMGRVVMENTENMRFNGIRLHIRGKAHAEWKISRAGERRTVRQDEHYIDDRQTLWGKEANDDATNVPIMPRGYHTFPFEFKLPESALPCSFESKYGTVRYYIRVTLDIPYASSPQGVKYFTIIGPHIDCMDERLLTPAHGSAKRNQCSLCCGKGPLLMRGMLERTGYCCGENVRLKVEIQNGADHDAWVRCQLVQHVEFFINKGVLGLSKEVRHVIAEAESDRVSAHHSSSITSLSDRMAVPVCPPTMVDVCGLVQIYYSLQLFLETEQEKEAAEIDLPVTIATLPFRIPNTPTPEIHYEEPAETVEGGNYISSEFQMGQVYMGEEQDLEIDRTIIYRPVYVTIRASRPPSVCRSTASSRTNLLQVPGSSRVRSTSRSRENLMVHVNGSRHSSHEDLSRLSRVRLDSSEHSDDESLGPGGAAAAAAAASRRTEPERIPLMCRTGSAEKERGGVGMRTATGAAAVGVTAAAAAATSPPPSFSPPPEPSPPPNPSPDPSLDPSPPPPISPPVPSKPSTPSESSPLPPPSPPSSPPPTASLL